MYVRPPSLRLDRVLLREASVLPPRNRYRRCPRISLPLLLPFAVVFIIATVVVSIVNFLLAGQEIGFIPTEPFDLFVISAYYYPMSKSLGDNSIALVLTGDYEFDDKIGELTIIGWNDTDNAMATVEIDRITPHNVCRWISMFATAPLLPGMNKMAISLGNKYTEIDFVIPSPVRHDVVSCISPLFANEQWQYLLFAAHTYKKFGSHMHLYIRSMVTPVYKLMEEYEREGYLTIQPWIRVELSSIGERNFNPNINIEFRNQAAAQTDCLLQYKETATFISFVDLDDIIIPRLGSTYLEEFDHLFNIEPNIAFLHYSKYNVHVEGQRKPQDFSLTQMYSSIKFSDEIETGKMVTRPATFNSTWIHWPNTVPEGMIRYDVGAHQNVITHLKLMENEDHSASTKLRVPKYLSQDGGHLLSSTAILEMQEDMMRMKKQPGVSSIWEDLPKDSFYFDLILKCFNDTYYKFHYGKRYSEIKCPGPDRCNFPPSPGIECSNARAIFNSTTRGQHINLHTSNSAEFVNQDGCIP